MDSRNNQKNHCIRLDKIPAADTEESRTLSLSEADTQDIGSIAASAGRNGAAPSWHRSDSGPSSRLESDAAETSRQEPGPGAPSAPGQNNSPSDLRERSEGRPESDAASAKEASKAAAGLGRPEGEGELRAEFDGEIKPVAGTEAENRHIGLKAFLIFMSVLLLLGLCGLFAYTLNRDGGENSKPVLEIAAEAAPENTVFLAAFDFEREADMLAVQRRMAESFLNNASLMSVFINKDASVGKYVDFNSGLSKRLLGAGAIIADLRWNGTRTEGGRVVYLQKVDDEKAAADALERITDGLRSKQLLSYTVKEYGDIRLHVPAGDEPGVVWTVRDGLLWLGSSAEALREILQPEPGFRPLSANPVYRKALADAPRHENGLIYCNMGEAFADISGEENLLTQALKNGRYAVVGLKVRGGGAEAPGGAVLEYNGHAVFNEAFVGRVKAQIFNSGNVIEFKSLKYQPAANGSCLGVNIRMLFDIFGEALGQVSEMGATEGGSSWAVRSAAGMLRPLLECCTGELSFSMKNLGELSGSRGLENGGGSANFAAKLRSEPWTVCLGLRSRDEFEAALNANPFIAMFLKRMEQRSAGGAKIYELFGGVVQLALNDDMLIILGNASGAEAEKVVTGGLENSWHGEMAKISGNAPFKGIGFLVEDVRSNTKAVADGLSERGGVNAGAGKTLWSISETLGVRLSVISVDERGLVISGAAEFSAK